MLFQIGKDEFNKIAKELLGEANIHVHNEFVLALLLKCQQTHRGFKRGSMFYCCLIRFTSFQFKVREKGHVAMQCHLMID